MIGVYALTAVTIALALIIVWLLATRDRAVTRRIELRRMRRERDLAITALDQIDRAADRVRDLGDLSAALAFEVRQIIHENREQRT